MACFHHSQRPKKKKFIPKAPNIGAHDVVEPLLIKSTYGARFFMWARSLLVFSHSHSSTLLFIYSPFSALLQCVECVYVVSCVLLCDIAVRSMDIHCIYCIAD